MGKKEKKRFKLLDKDKLPIVGKAFDLLYPTILIFTVAIVLMFYKLMNPTSEILNYIVGLLAAGFFLVFIDYVR